HRNEIVDGVRAVDVRKDLLERYPDVDVARHHSAHLGRHDADDPKFSGAVYTIAPPQRGIELDHLAEHGAVAVITFAPVALGNHSDACGIRIVLRGRESSPE